MRSSTAQSTTGRPGSRPATIETRATTGRIAGLDLLRLFAALAVVLFHFGYANTVSTPRLSDVAFPELAAFAKYGFLGVDLFFLISGFVIASTAEGRSAVAFAIARAGRLYPAFVVCMTLTTLVIVIGRSPMHLASFPQWLANLTMWAPRLGFKHIDGVYWTIVLELVFYGWVALLIALGLYQRRLLTIVTAWLAICFIAEVILETKSLRTAMLTEYAPLFASGILIHRIRRRIAGPAEWALLAFAFVLGGLHAIDMRDHFQLHYATPLDLTTLWQLHTGIYALFAATLWISTHMRSTPLLLALGGLTYPLYLLHLTAGAIFLDRLTPAIGRWPALAIVVAQMLALSWLVYRHVEPHGRRLLTMTLNAVAGFCTDRTTLPRAMPQ
jgi:peptidoglycan/LPS O-acetylase OafA/YrhL